MLKPVTPTPSGPKLQRMPSMKNTAERIKRIGLLKVVLVLMEFMVSALVQDWIIRKCMESDLYILLNRYN